MNGPTWVRLGEPDLDRGHGQRRVDLAPALVAGEPYNLQFA